MDELTKDDILTALSEVAVELALTGERHEIAIAGGAAIVLLYGARSSTKDIDAAVVETRRQSRRGLVDA